MLSVNQMSCSVKSQFLSFLFSVFLLAGCQTGENNLGAINPEMGLGLISASIIEYPPGAPKIISNYKSMVGVNGGRRPALHQGIDIIGPNRQPVLAVADGKVLEATVEKCWGPTIAIDHGKAFDGGKLVALYGHVGEMLVSEGDRVERGELIARLSNNQGKFKCIGGIRHLHFQLGQQYRKKNDKGTAWGHSFFLYDGGKGINPHLLWADGPNKVTCFESSRNYKAGTLTYPFPCNK